MNLISKGPVTYYDNTMMKNDSFCCAVHIYATLFSLWVDFAYGVDSLFLISFLFKIYSMTISFPFRINEKKQQ